MARSSSINVFVKLRGQRQFARELAASGAQLEAMGVKGARSIAAFAATGDKLKSFGRSWTRNVSLPMTVAVGLAGKAAVDWEDSFAGVRKTVDATESQFASLERGLRSMALHIPVAANDLAGIAEAAGQLGIRRQAILGFTRVIADLGVATNLAGEEGASTLARFANITQMPQSQFQRLGSVIVALGNAGASTEKDIAQMGLRIAAAGNFVGMSEAHILGFSNALSSVGIEAEAGGTAISQVIKVINSAVSGGGRDLSRFAEIAGVTGGQFAKSWKRDAAGALVGWIEGLARLRDQGEDVPAVLGSLSTKLRGIRVQDALLRAAGAGDLMRESLALGAKSWRENNALTEEAQKRYKTTASQLKILKNKVVEAGISLGQDLLPPLIQLVNFVGPRIGEIAHGFAALPGPVKATALGLLILTGPVASGLGYFASGIGRSIILVNKLATAGRSLAIFQTAMASGQGFQGASAMAFQGGGAAAAMNVAKGFVLSLAPALAALGVANVTMEALQGDWKAAGFKAGGAIAGGIAGFMVGGPLGAMLGVGIGSVGGGLISKAFDRIFASGQAIPTLQQKVAASSKQVAHWFKEQERASGGLVSASGAMVRARRREDAMARAVRTAESSLGVVRRKFGAWSQPALTAETQLTIAKNRHFQATKRLQNANRLHGVALSAYKTITRQALGAEKAHIALLKERVRETTRNYNASRFNNASSKRQAAAARAVLRAQGGLSRAQRNYARTLLDAAQKAGPSWARAQSRMSATMLRFGTRLSDFTPKLNNLGRNPSPRKLADAFRDMDRRLAPILQRSQRQVDALDRRIRNLGALSLTNPDFGVPTVPAPRRRPPTRRRGTAAAGGGRARQTLAAFNFGARGGGDGRPITISIPLDGKVLAESTVRVSEDDAALA